MKIAEGNANQKSESDTIKKPRDDFIIVKASDDIRSTTVDADMEFANVENDVDLTTGRDDEEFPKVWDDVLLTTGEEAKCIFNVTRAYYVYRRGAYAVSHGYASTWPGFNITGKLGMCVPSPSQREWKS